MSAKPVLFRAVWLWACLGGVALLAWLASEVRVPEAPRPGRESAGASFGIADSGAVQGARLFDPTPLFLPTAFNSSRRDYVPREPADAFAGFGAKFSFAESGLALRLPPAAEVPASPTEALAGEPPGVPFLGFGRRAIIVQTLAPRGAYVEVQETATGRSVLAEAVDAHPPEAVSWQPIEFMAAVDAAGLVGPVVPVVHSGTDGVDAYFAQYLAAGFRLGQRLAPGFYRVIVGP